MLLAFQNRDERFVAILRTGEVSVARFSHYQMEIVAKLRSVILANVNKSSLVWSFDGRLLFVLTKSLQVVELLFNPECYSLGANNSYRVELDKHASGIKTVAQAGKK